MYKIHQFKPTLYVLLILGLTGFAVAAQEPGLWALSVGAVLIQAWLEYKGRFKPISALLSNTISLVAVSYGAVAWFNSTEIPVLIIGQVLIALNLVKLYEQRGNRDYAVLMLLSVLLMVASGITTASLTFGILFIIHIFLSIYCYLLFHLKREADRALAAQPVPPDRFSTASIRQDQRYLPRSMRKLIALIATVSTGSAVFVFLFFPRGPGTGLLGQMQVRPPEVLTGFSDEVQFNQIAKITQNDTPVAAIWVWRNGQALTNGSLRLRGTTFDQYRRGKGGTWEWKRSPEMDDSVTEKDCSPYHPLILSRGSGGHEEWRQQIQLEPITSKTLFALAGIDELAPLHSEQKDSELKVSYAWGDETIRRPDEVNAPVFYEVYSTGSLTPPWPGGRALAPEQIKALPSRRLPQLSQDIDPLVSQFAHDPAVSGDMVSKRPADAILSDLDGQIAANIESYLKSHFSYTLDLDADAGDLFNGKDPLAAFLTQTHRGHCEFFAGAMTLACQSLGLRARMVVGFVTDEYNSLGGFFQVRQSHAHAWVEVLTPDRGWLVFDPTSGRELPPNEQRSVLQRLRHVFDYLESKWASAVIAYDGGRRYTLIQNLDVALLHQTIRGAEQASRFQNWWKQLNVLGATEFWSISVKILVTVITLVLLALVGAIGWFILERHRIRRRARKIGLDDLPVSQQLRLARQLGFYEQMNELLRAHRIVRRPHMTPQEFSHSLTFLPIEAYKLVDGLTRIFYRVRYGGVEVPADQQERLAVAVNRLADHLVGYDHRALKE